MGSKKLAACALAMPLAACAGGDGRSSAPAAAVTPVAVAAGANALDWRTVATTADRDRLRRWRDAWMVALPAARRADATAVAAQGVLFDPDRALDRALPPPGAYRCRVFKLGSTAAVNLGYVAYPYFSCRIEAQGEMLSLFKETGSQRPVGLLFPDNGARAVFLGTMMLSDERAPLEYGQDADRDMAGFIERIGERRWRLVLPWPRFESKLDVVELVPA